MSKALKFPPDAYAGDVHHPDVFVRLASMVSVLRAAWKELRTYRNDVARLQAMDESMLKDIGLTRSEIGSAVRFGRCSWSKDDLLAAIEDLERRTIADIQTGD